MRHPLGRKDSGIVQGMGACPLVRCDKTEEWDLSAGDQPCQNKWAGCDKTEEWDLSAGDQPCQNKWAGYLKLRSSQRRASYVAKIFVNIV